MPNERHLGTNVLFMSDVSEFIRKYRIASKMYFLQTRQKLLFGFRLTVLVTVIPSVGGSPKQST